jgi:hypothetical protein
MNVGASIANYNSPRIWRRWQRAFWVFPTPLVIHSLLHSHIDYYAGFGGTYGAQTTIPLDDVIPKGVIIAFGAFSAIMVRVFVFCFCHVFDQCMPSMYSFNSFRC